MQERRPRYSNPRQIGTNRQNEGRNEGDNVSVYNPDVTKEYTDQYQSQERRRVYPATSPRGDPNTHLRESCRNAQ